jgi:hypothetical protein
MSLFSDYHIYINTIFPPDHQLFMIYDMHFSQYSGLSFEETEFQYAFTWVYRHFKHYK